MEIIIPGTPAYVPKHQSLRAFFPEAEIRSYQLVVTRGAEQLLQATDLKQEDVVVTEFEGNIQWFHSGGDFINKLQTQQSFTRGAMPGKLIVPTQWQEDNAPSRGIVTSALKLVGINVFKNVAGRALAIDIAKRIEQNNPNILYNCDEKFNLGKPFDKTETKAGTSKYLLLLHGTGSSTKGGFGGLINNQGEGVYKNLFANYEGRIIAYEHKTFSQSAVQNIIELITQLPDAVTLDILSHSRGGLLGEILARISSQGWSGVFTPDEMNLLRQNEEAAALVTEIETLNKAVEKKQIKVNLFVRVACPAAGTTLVSDRADKLLNVIVNILSNIPGEVTSTIIEGITALLTAVVNEKNNTATLPGIECMKPHSNFIKALNYYQTKIDSELIVIAGDAVGEGFVNKIKMFLVDSFYKENNDLVVNTISMKKGTGRTKNFLIYDEQAANVNHFHYFLNDSSQKIIVRALTGKADETRGFYSSTILQRGAAPNVTVAANRSGKTITKDQPVLYVLPGIMGSNLRADNDPVWLNYFKIATGNLKRIKLDGSDNVTAEGINGNTYKTLVDYFSSYYYVIPFAYDWRKSIFDAAEELKKDIEKTISQTDNAVSFVVHSMGGLVFRAFAIQHKELWKQLQERPNCKVLMLGTPNLGSYAIPRLLLGNDRSINALAALDLTSSKKTLLDQFVNYIGLLELLPAKGKDDFGNAETWNDIKEYSGTNYSMPGTTALTGYLKMQGNDFINFKYDPNIVKYVAGRDDQTPCGIQIDKDNNKVNFYATTCGDGSVTWDSIPDELHSATYYVNAKHGSLAKHEASFKGYKDLLSAGTTNQLSAAPPITRGETKPELMPEHEEVTVPDEAALNDHVMGIEVTETKAPKQQVEVSITHGDLGHAMFPLIVGHFRGDGILQAEKILDTKLDSYLSLRHATNNYPGAIGTHEVICKTNNYQGAAGTHEVIFKPSESKCAIIVGLGDFGGLTENLLAQTLRQALLTYIIQTKEKKTSNTISNGVTGVSYLLIGSGFGGLTIYSSIKALLTAVKDANSFFETGNYTNYSLINRVEIIELYQYKAVQAARIMRSFIGSNSLFSNISFNPDIIKRASGARTEIPDEMQTDWWHRLKISQTEENEDCNGHVISRAITFNSITDKARNEEKVLNTNIIMVDKLIKQGASFSNNNKPLCQTIYELLVPNEFKGYGSDLRNIVLLLDKETARYPWEMMIDAYGDRQEPLVTKTGFLRQLATSTYRENVDMPFANNALVVGNPALNGYYPNLPGAAIEAQQVALLLTNNGYNVNDNYIDKEASGVLLQLYSEPFKIIHIAAHGVLKDKMTCQTGIVLGEQLILTPSDFKQMRKVPELVFINCCSLGTINKEDEERLHRKYEVAAGIGTQLIEMGVKTVIVAGWEVNDEAAFNFSNTFYTELLKGRNFGDSVQTARESTYLQYSQYNTWGAYQCYGDPLYILRTIADGNDKNDLYFCDPVEAMNLLDTLISQAEAATSRDKKEGMKTRIDKVVKAIQVHPEWKYNASITQQMAELYKRLGMTQDAIEFYELLFSMEDAQYTVKTIEQYCNVKVKQAEKEWKKVQDDETVINKKTSARKAVKTIDEMIKRLQSLNIKPTSERFNLIASAYRRLAVINSEDPKKYIDYLAKCADSYYHGYEVFFDVYGKSYYYPLYNWLIIAVILENLQSEFDSAEYKSMLTIPANLNDIMQNADSYVDELEKSQPDFWNKTADSTKFLLLLILSKDIAEIEKYINNIIQNHLHGWEIEGSIYKQKAISEHAAFVINMFETYKSKLTAFEPIDKKLEALNSLQEQLKNF